jgi:alanine racemase
MRPADRVVQLLDALRPAGDGGQVRPREGRVGHVHDLHGAGRVDPPFGAEEVAERLGTINYEAVSAILARVPRETLA